MGESFHGKKKLKVVERMQWQFLVDFKEQTTLCFFKVLLEISYVFLL